MTVGDHLTPTASRRGFDSLPPIEGDYGGDIVVYESSAADEQKIWLVVREADDLNDASICRQVGREYTGGYHEARLHLVAADAWKLKEQLEYLLAHHYQGDARP